jgi:hypothetical protein
MRSPVRELRAALVELASLLVFAGCVPSPRSFVADPGILTRSAATDSTHNPAAANAAVRLAVLPLANYTPASDAADRLVPMLISDLGSRPGIEVAEPGAVQAELEKEPWLLLDRLPPDLVDRLGADLHVDALLLGGLLTYGYRDAGGERVPQVSMALRLVQCPSSRVLWSAVHSRDGEDGEWLFGFGRVRSLEQLASQTVHELLETFPEPAAEFRTNHATEKGK